MPSGAKRRKAAKKKKEKTAVATNSSSSSQQGNGYSPKSQDDRDSHSDSDTNSPAGSQEHGNPFGGEEQDEKLNGEKGVSGDLGEPQRVEIEKSEVLGEGEDDAVTKEVDSESRVVDIEAVKETEEGEDSGVDGKRREFEPPLKEELRGSNGGKAEIDVVEIDVAVDPLGEVVSLTKELIHDPQKQIVCQSEEPTRAVEVNPVEKTGDPSGDREVDVLPSSNGTVVEPSNDDDNLVEFHSRATSESPRKELATVAPIVRPTSWKSCCGLFEVLTGSNR